MQAWPLRTLLAAVEARLEAGAEDAKDWEKTRRRLHAPPPGVGREAVEVRRPAGIDLAAARALAARAAAEDSQYAARR